MLSTEGTLEKIIFFIFNFCSFFYSLFCENLENTDKQKEKIKISCDFIIQKYHYKILLYSYLVKCSLQKWNKIGNAVKYIEW